MLKYSLHCTLMSFMKIFVFFFFFIFSEKKFLCLILFWYMKVYDYDVCVIKTFHLSLSSCFCIKAKTDTGYLDNFKKVDSRNVTKSMLFCGPQISSNGNFIVSAVTLSNHHWVRNLSFLLLLISWTLKCFSKLEFTCLASTLTF